MVRRDPALPAARRICYTVRIGLSAARIVADMARGGRSGPHVGEVRKPKLTEVVAMKQLLDGAVAQGDVLPRELPELYENVRDFNVYSEDGILGGIVALHIDMIDLAEVRSLIVSGALRGRGIGAKLLEAAVEEARGLDIARVYALTRVEEFFIKNGFRIVDKQELPYKVFKDCMRCRLFPGCDEVAVVRDLK